MGRKSMSRDIALIDDDGVTAVFAHNPRAQEIATKVAALSGMSILWGGHHYEEFYPDGVIDVGAITLCPEHFANFGQQLSDAGLVVIYPDMEQ
jgi:hypothetical protein